MRNKALSIGVWLLLVVGVVSLAGCAASPVAKAPAPSTVREADAAAVAHCKYLGKVASGVELDKAADFLNLWKERGLDKCKTDCLNEAQTKGATHLVWDKLRSDHAVARIYNCTP